MNLSHVQAAKMGLMVLAEFGQGIDGHVLPSPSPKLVSSCAKSHFHTALP